MGRWEDRWFVDRPPHYGVEYLAEAERMRASGAVFETQVIDLAAARRRFGQVRVAPQAPPVDDLARGVSSHCRMLARREVDRLARQLAGGAYVAGPRKGQPLDGDDRARKEIRLRTVREWLAEEPA